VPDPRPDEAILFEDFFAAGLRMPPHLILLDILRNFRVQLHQLTLNAIVHISIFIWVVASCGGVLLPVSSLNTMNCIIRIRRFNSRGPRVPSSLNLAALIFTLVRSGIERSLLLL
jgi:hypothetical protein